MKAPFKCPFKSICKGPFNSCDQRLSGTTNREMQITVDVRCKAYIHGDDQMAGQRQTRLNRAYSNPNGVEFYLFFCCFFVVTPAMATCPFLFCVSYSGDHKSILCVFVVVLSSMASLCFFVCLH